MAIICFGASLKHPSSEIVELAIGVEDKRGNPFELITLDWNRKKKNTHLAKTRGFEDAVITLNDSGITVDYRLPGCATWIMNDITKQFTARVPYTPHNMAVLGSHFGDGLWTIRDIGKRNQAQVIYEKIREQMSSTQRENDDLRQKGHFISMFDVKDGVPVLDNYKASGDDPVNIMTQKTDLAKKEAALSEKERAIDVKMAWMEKKIAELQSQGIMLASYSQESLSEKNIGELRTLAKQLGMKISNTDKKEGLIVKILRNQYEGMPSSGNDENDILEDNYEPKQEVGEFSSPVSN